MRLFHNRQEAAHELARHLSFMKNESPIVLGLANGGVPLAEVIAKALDAPLDVLLIERLRAPKNPEHIVGAVDEHGRISMIKSTARWHHLTSKQMVQPARDAFRELQIRRGGIRSLLPEMDVRDRTVIIVSQGISSGAKMLGGVSSVRDRGARKVVVAAPAGAGEAAWQLHEAADLVVIPHRPTKFTSVENLYREFSDVTDGIVRAIVERWVKSRPEQQPGVRTVITKVPNAAGHLLCCELDLPPGASRGSGPYPAVVFAHGYESDGRNPRSIPISRRLAKRGIIGIRMNFTGHGQSQGELAEASEASMYDDLKRVLIAIRHLDEVDTNRIGLIGSGSGSMLAMNLSAEDPSILRSIVARGPMHGTEIEALLHVKTPSLLIYAEQERDFAERVRKHRKDIPSTHEILEVPDATRLFNDAISLELMVNASVQWTTDHLGVSSSDSSAAMPAITETPKEDGHF